MVSERQVSLAVQGLNAKFAEILHGRVPTPWQSLYMTQPSQAASETYEFFGTVPQLVEWKDEIEIGDVGAGTFTLLNKDWASGIAVSKNLIADNRLSQITPNMTQLAKRAATWQVPQVRKLLAASAGTTLGVCYDGKALIAADHQTGASGAQSNTCTGTGVTYDKIQADWAAASARAASWLDDQGQPLELGEDYLDTAIVPPSGPIIMSFWTLMGGQQALGTPDMSGRVKQLLIDPGLTDTNDWYAVSTSGVFRPFLYQERQAPYTESDTSPKRKSIDYLAKARGAFGYGDWKTIIRTTN